MSNSSHPGQRAPGRDGLDRAFRIALVLKSIDGLIEALGGLLLLFATPTALQTIVEALTRGELQEDPSDALANRLLHFAHTTDLSSSGVRFAAVYLLLHGAAKLLLVGALFRDKLWAYPWMIGFLGIFIGYQLYRIAVHPSMPLVLLTIFDAVLVWLTWREWKRHPARLAAASAGPGSAGAPTSGP